MLLKHDLDGHGDVGAGCRLWGLQPSRLWKDSSEGAKEIDVGRRFHLETAGEEGMKDFLRNKNKHKRLVI